MATTRSPPGATVNTHNTNRNDDEISRNERNQLRQTWGEFLRALNSTQPFNPLTWIYRLSRAVALHVHHWTGCAHIFQRYDLGKAWLPTIPIFAMSLILFVVFAYFASIRTVVKERWCCSNNGDATTTTCLADYCSWIYLHDVTIIYLSGMILFHYIQTTFHSPGVALATAAAVAPALLPPWSAMDSQGGMLGCNPVCDEAAERKRVELYGALPTGGKALISAVQADSSIGPSTTVFPSPEPTYCHKCCIVRPARCHHCGTCNRCVLQFDHHCVWVNNCIGLSNYRSFFLMLFFLMLGCWYGVALLFYPFYEPLRAQVEELGWRFMYANGTGFLDLPPLSKIAQLVWSGQGLEVKMVVDIVYPLLLGVGLVLSVFFGMHVKYVLKANTSLEHRIVLEQAIASITTLASLAVLVQPITRASSSRKKQLPNPFDQGWYKNLLQTLGPNLLLILLPLSVRIPPPYVPHNGASDTKTK